MGEQENQERKLLQLSLWARADNNEKKDYSKNHARTLLRVA